MKLLNRAIIRVFTKQKVKSHRKKDLYLLYIHFLQYYMLHPILSEANGILKQKVSYFTSASIGSKVFGFLSDPMVSNSNYVHPIILIMDAVIHWHVLVGLVQYWYELENQDIGGWLTLRTIGNCRTCRTIFH